MKEFKEDNLTDWAAALTYYGVLSIFPALLALVSILGLLGAGTIRQLIDNLRSLAPGGARDILTSMLRQLEGNQGRATLALIIGIVIALWSASGYLAAFMRASNAVYDIGEGRPVWKTLPTRLAITVVAVILLAAIAVGVVFTGTLAQKTGEIPGLGDTSVTVWNIAKWPVMVLLFMLIVALLYWASPNVKRKMRRVSPGNIVAAGHGPPHTPVREGLIVVTASAAFRTPPPHTSGSDFARLSKKIADAGLMVRRPGYYVARITGVAALYAGGWTAFLLMGANWWQMAVAAFLALVFGQVALLAHDVAHRQVFRRRKASELAGRIAGAGIGMGYGWWQDKHNRHHANPNHEELDPDIAPNLLIWTQDQARAAKGLPRLIGRWQAFLFFPLLTLEGINLHASSAKALANRSLKHRTLDGTLLLAHCAVYLTALFLVLPPSIAVAFLLVHQCLFGVYLGCLFAPNHKGMPTLTGNDRPDFLRRQVLTSRNVHGGWFTDLAMGGLNYQIEHHLFPSMPSPNLRKAQPIVRGYCRQLGVNYLETKLITSYRQALTGLHHTGTPIRHPQSA